MSGGAAPALCLHDVVYTHVVVLAGIHAEAFDDPWSVEGILPMLRIPSTVGVLALAGDEPAGFILVRAIVDEAEILTLAVRPRFRRQGVAAALLEAMATRLRRRDVSQVFLEVAVDNTGAIALYETAGFKHSGLRRGYYAHRDGSRTDAHVMTLCL